MVLETKQQIRKVGWKDVSVPRSREARSSLSHSPLGSQSTVPSKHRSDHLTLLLKAIPCLPGPSSGIYYCCSVASSCLTFRHGLDHARLSCLSLSPRVCSHSCPLSDENQQGCYARLSISGSLAMHPACKILCSISLPCARDLCVLIYTP